MLHLGCLRLKVSNVSPVKLGNHCIAGEAARRRQPVMVVLFCQQIKKVRVHMQQIVHTTNNRKKILTQYNLFFWAVILLSVFIIWLVFNPFYDPQGLSLPICLGIIAGSPIITVAAHLIIWRRNKHRLVPKRKIGGLGILFMVVLSIIYSAILFFTWLGAEIMRKRIDIGSLYIVTAPFLSFGIYYFTNKLILRINAHNKK